MHLTSYFKANLRNQLILTQRSDASHIQPLVSETAGGEHIARDSMGGTCRHHEPPLLRVVHDVRLQLARGLVKMKPTRSIGSVGSVVARSYRDSMRKKRMRAANPSCA